MRALAISVAIIAAAPADAQESEPRLARAPSDMSGAEIDAYNDGRMASDPGYIRCRRIEQIGSLVKKLRVCNINADTKRTVEMRKQDVRDSTETPPRGWTVPQQPQQQPVQVPTRRQWTGRRAKQSGDDPLQDAW